MRRKLIIKACLWQTRGTSVEPLRCGGAQTWSARFRVCVTVVWPQAFALRVRTAAPFVRHSHIRVHTRTTACGSRVAEMWNLWGSPNLEREIESLCDVCGITDASTTRHNLTATCSDIRTRVKAHARNCVWQPRGKNMEPLRVLNFGTRESKLV